jgi:hypothetical protein
MPRRTVVAAAFFLVAVVVGTPGLNAWGNDGHRVICQIAWERLTTQGRKLVQDIQADVTSVRDPFRDCATCSSSHPDDGRAMTFQMGCIWPDESREDTFKGTYEYHFINVANAATALDLERDCASLDCVAIGIQRFAQYVSMTPRGGRERERRVLALRFLGHFVGDLHQPLHVGFAEDIGGNSIDVKWNTGTTTVDRTLHSVWDSAILQRAGLTDQVDDGRALNKEITAAELAAWQDFDIAKWAGESFAAARATAYTKPDGTRVQDNDTLSTPYFNAAQPVAREQLKRAGVRLAHLINAAAAGTLPKNMIGVGQ